MTELATYDGEPLDVPERMIVAPSAGVFRPGPRGEQEQRLVREGETIGLIEGPGIRTEVRSPFHGHLMGMVAHPGERLRQGQRIAWLLVA